MKFTHPTAMKPSSPNFKVREPSTRLADTKRGNRFPLYLGERAGVRASVTLTFAYAIHAIPTTKANLYNHHHQP